MSQPPSSLPADAGAGVDAGAPLSDCWELPKPHTHLIDQPGEVASVEEGTLLLAPGVAAGRAIRSGDVVVGAIPSAPFLREVTGVEGDRLATVPARLTDAFEELHYSTACPPLGRPGGLAFGEVALETSRTLRIAVADGDLSASGELGLVLTGSLFMRLDVEAGVLSGFEATFGLTAEVPLSVQLEIRRRWSVPRKTLLALPEVRLSQPVPIGPVVVTPLLSAALELEVSAEGAFSVHLARRNLLELRATAGMEFEPRGGWSPVPPQVAAEILPGAAGLQDVTPVLHGEAHARLSFPVEIKVRLYELGGPGIELAPCLRLDATGSALASNPGACFQIRSELSTCFTAAVIGEINPLGLWEIEWRQELADDSSPLFAALVRSAAPCCGDQVCSSDAGETCSTCDADCGACGCASSFCQQGDHRSGRWCDGDDAVLCGVSSGCPIETSRASCPSGCANGACVCAPSCVACRTTAVPDGCGGTCPANCSGTCSNGVCMRPAPVCPVCRTSDVPDGQGGTCARNCGTRCDGDTCACAPACDACRTRDISDGCGGTCPANCSTRCSSGACEARTCPNGTCDPSESCTSCPGDCPDRTPPSTPTILTPTPRGSPGVGIAGPTANVSLTWSASSDSCSSIARYEVRITQVSGTFARTYAVTGTSLNVQLGRGLYRWDVAAINGVGMSSAASSAAYFHVFETWSPRAWSGTMNITPPPSNASCGHPSGASACFNATEIGTVVDVDAHVDVCHPRASDVCWWFGSNNGSSSYYTLSGSLPCTSSQHVTTNLAGTPLAGIWCVHVKDTVVGGNGSLMSANLRVRYY